MSHKSNKKLILIGTFYSISATFDQCVPINFNNSPYLMGTFEHQTSQNSRNVPINPQDLSFLWVCRKTPQRIRLWKIKIP